jgi:cytochrome c biogenesis protein CcmG/thiol:disulfide interchange protein DsbE
MRSRVALISAAALAVVLAAFVFVLATSEPATTRKADSPLLGKIAPALTADSALTSERYDLIDDAGEWVLVNFFATWCTPCVAEHDDLVSFSNAHSLAGDARVVSVVFSDTEKNVRAFFAENGGDWPVVIDDDGQIATDWGVPQVPESYLVSPDGRVRAKIIGGIEVDKLERLLAEAKGS